MDKTTGTPTLTVVRGGLDVPRPALTVVSRPSERHAYDATREEWRTIDPATGRVLSVVTAEDEADLALMLQDEEWARRPDAQAYAPHGLSDHPSGLSAAARHSLGLFVVAAVEDDVRDGWAS